MQQQTATDTEDLRARDIYARNSHQNIYVQRIASLKKQW